MYACMYECTYVCMYVCTCTCTCIRIYMCVYIYIYVCLICLFSRLCVGVCSLFINLYCFRCCSSFAVLVWVCFFTCGSILGVALYLLWFFEVLLFLYWLLVVSRGRPSFAHEHESVGTDSKLNVQGCLKLY